MDGIGVGRCTEDKMKFIRSHKVLDWGIVGLSRQSLIQFGKPESSCRNR